MLPVASVIIKSLSFYVRVALISLVYVFVVSPLKLTSAPVQNLYDSAPLKRNGRRSNCALVAQIMSTVQQSLSLLK